VTEQTGAEVRADAADAARQARGVLAALAGPDDGLTATAAMRNRIEAPRSPSTPDQAAQDQQRVPH